VSNSDPTWCCEGSSEAARAGAQAFRKHGFVCTFYDVCMEQGNSFGEKAMFNDRKMCHPFALLLLQLRE
jgi:hypothetical protein